MLQLKRLIFYRISKNWKYHKDLKLWFQQAGDLIAKTNTYERGSYIYFDVNAWKKVQKDDFVLGK
jgi:CCR4-NOT transcription complex subunit 2